MLKKCMLLGAMFAGTCTGLDYSYISLSTKHTSRADAYLTVGASLYQHSTKFDIWPYLDTRYSGAEQDQLRIYVK